MIAVTHSDMAAGPRPAREVLKAPFPWFGGKSRAAGLLWPRFGDVPNYVEPFGGSLAVLLRRPHEPRAETVNDIDCYVSNFWRATQAEPEAVARYADWPVSEADLHARHRWLVDQVDFRERMMTEPDYYDVKIAGWWVWGICQWIGGGWCGWAKPNWNVRPHLRRAQGVLQKRPMKGAVGVHRKRMQLGRSGRGIHRKLVRSLPNLGGDGSGSGRGVLRWGYDSRQGLEEWFGALRQRLRRVRVCCGDWQRVLGPSPTTHIGVTAVDPPYGREANRYSRKCGLYAHDDLEVAEAVRDWAVTHGDDPRLRIALCGYQGEHRMPRGWTCVAWKTAGGYGRRQGRINCGRERIWFSPHCLKVDAMDGGGR